MPWVGFEPTIPASERAKTVHALDRAVTVTDPPPTSRCYQLMNVLRYILIFCFYLNVGFAGGLCLQFSISRATCVNIFKLILDYKSLVHYTFRLMSSSGASKLTLKSAAPPSTNVIPNYILFYAPMCRSFVVLCDSSYVSCAEERILSF
jgi:hypothetical protein